MRSWIEDFGSPCPDSKQDNYTENPNIHYEKRNVYSAI